MATIGYIFLAAQREYLLPLIDQQNELDNYAKNTLQLSLDEIFVEEAGTMKKPLRERHEGRKLLERLKEGDTLIVQKASWVLSSPKEAVRLIKVLVRKNIELHCTDLGENISIPAERKLVVSEGSAAIVLGVMEALALCESSKHGESIRAAKKQLKKEGRYLGGPVPFGWKVSSTSGELVQNPSEQRVIKEIIRLREDRWSYRDISVKLREGFQVKLSHEGIRKILDRNREKLAKEKKAQPKTPSVQVVPGLEKHIFNKD